MGSALLEGVWMDGDSPKQFICTIVENCVRWNDAMFGEKQAPVQLEPRPDGTFLMDLSGEQCTATFVPGPPAQLRWSDGAIWTRDELQGTWVTTSDDTTDKVGSISEGHVHWDARFCHPPSALSPIPCLPFGTVAMSMEGEETTATFDP